MTFSGKTPFIIGICGGSGAGKTTLLRRLSDIFGEVRPSIFSMDNYYFPKFAKEATRIATVSEYSKQDIVKNYGINKDKIDVVYNGCNENFKPVTVEVKEETKKKFSSLHICRNNWAFSSPNKGSNY